MPIAVAVAVVVVVVAVAATVVVIVAVAATVAAATELELLLLAGVAVVAIIVAAAAVDASLKLLLLLLDCIIAMSWFLFSACCGIRLPPMGGRMLPHAIASAASGGAMLLLLQLLLLGLSAAAAASVVPLACTDSGNCAADDVGEFAQLLLLPLPPLTFTLTPTPQLLGVVGGVRLVGLARAQGTQSMAQCSRSLVM